MELTQDKLSPHQDNPAPDLESRPSKPKHLPFAFAKRHGVLIEEKQDEKVVILCKRGMSTPVLSEVRRYLGVPVVLKVIDSEEFDVRLQQAYELGGNQAMDMMDDLDDEADLNKVAQELAEPEDLLESEDDAPIIRLINALLTQAIKENASDIHVESFESRLVVRFRVDGVLREVLEPNRALAPLIVSRIKVMAKLDIAEKRLPQDGRISIRIAGRAVDVRVSTIPTGQGERVVLRLLDKQAGRLNLEQLGMEAGSRDLFDKLIHRPHGIVLVTGPTGSGKTTTLYAGLTRINNKKRNIMTVEDPIEYYLDGIGQTNVNAKVDMTFARGLRAILRQDPDVVMIGEIRDLETAEIAVQSSLTGHLVLSTLHTNSAVGAVTRLRDMGVEPFLLSSTLIGVLAQRLIRKLCPHCKQPYQPNEMDLEDFGLDKGEAQGVFRAEGCEQCNFQGYIGRTGIYELVLVDEEMRTMIHDGDSEQELEAHARKKTASIADDGARLVLAGETTFEEILRVTRES